MDSLSQRALELHAKYKGKIEMRSKIPFETRDDLSLAYTPGVGAVSKEIAVHPDKVWELTSRRNWVAVVSDGSAVLGLGDIGPAAALPVMEGKALLFKEFAGIDAFPICLATKDVDEIVRIVKALEPSFGGVNLEDISAPRCFEIEKRLKEMLSIPVMHDDQHGTAVVVLAGLINAATLIGKKLQLLRVVISGAGAAGTAIARILLREGVSDIVLTDSKGILSRERTDISGEKKRLAEETNPRVLSGSLERALVGSNVFIGVSAPGIMTHEMVSTMAADPIIFAMANPVPEIMPEEAQKGGARIIATGRSDFPNQINNVLAFPGIFRGVLDAHLSSITDEMKVAAAHAIAAYVKNPTVESFMPSVLDKGLSAVVARAVQIY